MSCSSVAWPRPNRSMKPGRSSAGSGAAWAGSWSTRACSARPTSCAALAAQIGLDYVDLGDALIDPSATCPGPGRRVPAAHARPGALRRRQARHRDGRPGQRHRAGRRPLDRQGRPQAGRVDPRRRHGGDRPRLPRRRRARQPEHGHRGPQHRGGGPHPDQGGRRGRPDRQVREPADHPGDPGRRLGHPHRADRARPARALPHRRRAARGDALARSRSSPGSPAA